MSENKEIEELLKQNARKEFDKIVDKANKVYNKTKKQAKTEYEMKVEQAKADFEKIREPAWINYLEKIKRYEK